MWLAPCVPREAAVEVLGSSTDESYHVVVAPLVPLPNPQIAILVWDFPLIFTLVLSGVGVDGGASSSGVVLVGPLGFVVGDPPPN